MKGVGVKLPFPLILSQPHVMMSRLLGWKLTVYDAQTLKHAGYPKCVCHYTVLVSLTVSRLSFYSCTLLCARVCLDSFLFDVVFLFLSPCKFKRLIA